jgi:hypothetical protein
LQAPSGATNVTLVVQSTPIANRSGRIPMSYAEAKEIALLRLELRACWDRGDRTGAHLALVRLSQMAGNDNELAAELRRWTARFAA